MNNGRDSLKYTAKCFHEYLSSTRHETSVGSFFYEFFNFYSMEIRDR